ncbi:MAG: hypothetical protein AAF429_07265 [Pseudomonadota bacterium]
MDHAKSFGLWDSFCDHRDTDGAREERCYLRYVDVFSPPPKFGAVFLFVTPEPKIEIGLEPGTLFAADGLQIEKDGQTVWDDVALTCRIGLNCTFEGDAATALLDHMQAGDIFAFDFTDRHGQTRKLRWDLGPFSEALLDYTAAKAERGL